MIAPQISRDVKRVIERKTPKAIGQDINVADPLPMIAAKRRSWTPRLDVISQQELGRLRVDCLVNICGFFRDIFAKFSFQKTSTEEKRPDRAANPRAANGRLARAHHSSLFISLWQVSAAKAIW